METTALGTTAALLMERLEEITFPGDDEKLRLGTVIIVVEVRGEDEMGDWTQIHFRCSDSRAWVQDGLLYAALNGETRFHEEDEPG